MQLHLQYKGVDNMQVAGAFIRGADPLAWLNEISSWNIPVDELTCYIIPESLQSPKPEGLLAIFKNPGQVKPALLDPYYCLAGKLYIPLNTVLLPEMTDEELRALLHWDCQVIHPAAGFAGFEKKDQFNLTDLFAFNKEQEADWSFAHPGVPASPAFHAIRVTPPNAEELMNDIREDIGEKDIKDIPKNRGDKRRSEISAAIDTVRRKLLSGLLAIVSGIWKVLPKVESDQPGLFQRMHDWLERNVDDLQKKRNDELNRLMGLFEENPEEALKYALPLNSPYLQRGKPGSSSVKLDKKTPTFNLSRLGGGRAVDSWDVSDHYDSLRRKYLLAAENAIAQKNYTRAAYIHAHLLGDYASAANVLEQEGAYREAAALYKDHLKNNLAAAECLERGNLLYEAIDLYKTLHREEKVGDLYMRVGQKETAYSFYEQDISEKLSQKDYLNASRIIKEKLEEEERAKDTLLEGWQKSHTPESCLKRYFDIVMADAAKHPEKELRTVFSKHTPPYRRKDLLNVLDHLYKKQNTQQFENAVKEIAYEIVNKQTQTGDRKIVGRLKTFFPEDSLLSADTSRYTTRSVVQSTPDPNASFQLDTSVRWMSTAWLRSQFLAAGKKNNQLHLARVNWHGNVEYYSWNHRMDDNTFFSFITATYESHTVFLELSGGVPVSRRNLPKNKYFGEAVVVRYPTWNAKAMMPMVMLDSGEVCCLQFQYGNITLQYYDATGSLCKTVPCQTAGKMTVANEVTDMKLVAYRNGYFFTHLSSEMLIIAESGVFVTHDFHGIIITFGTSFYFGSAYLVVLTNEGYFFLCKTSDGNLDVCGGDSFAQDAGIDKVMFISSGRFVIGGGNKAIVYRVDDNGSPVKIKEFETGSRIAGILPGSERQTFVVLTENGEINHLNYPD